MGSLPVRAGSLFKRKLSLIKNITLSFIWENLRMEGTQPVRARVPSLFYIILACRLRILKQFTMFAKNELKNIDL